MRAVSVGLLSFFVLSWPLLTAQALNPNPAQNKPAANQLTHPVAEADGCTPANAQSGRPAISPRRIEPQPYAVEFKTTTVQNLVDGTTITRKTREVEARNSRGDQLTVRTMIQEYGARIENVEQGHVHFAEDDSFLQWDSSSKSATLQKMPPRDQHNGCWANATGPLAISYNSTHRMNIGPAFDSSQKYIQPEQKTEQLGEDLIEGIKAQGIRTISTIPAGAIGNDKPLVSTQEVWIAEELPGVSLRLVISDPRFGKQTREVTSLKLGEPDTELFAAPKGYSLKTLEMHQVPCTAE